MTSDFFSAVKPLNIALLANAGVEFGLSDHPLVVALDFAYTHNLLPDWEDVNDQVDRDLHFAKFFIRGGIKYYFPIPGKNKEHEDES